MDEAHKQKLRDAYNKRRQAKERGVHLPTQKEIREAARTKKEKISEQSVNQLIEVTPVTAQKGRVNNAIATKFVSSPNIKHPLRFRMLHDQIESVPK